MCLSQRKADSDKEIPDIPQEGISLCESTAEFHFLQNKIFRNKSAQQIYIWGRKDFDGESES